MALKPRYVWKDWLHPTDEYPSGGYKEDIFSTNILIPLGNLFESHIGYKEVVELEQDGSYTKYTYTSHDDVKDEIPYGYLGLQYSHFDKFSDKSYYRGRIKTMEEYNATNNIQKRVSYIYNGAIVPPLSFGENYGITSDVSYGYKCDSQQDRYYKGSARKIFHFRYLMDMVTATYYFGNDQVQTQTNNQYARPIFASNKYAFLMQKSITNSDGKVFMDYYKYPFDHTSSYPGQQAHMTSLVNAHRFPVVYKEKKVNGIVFDIQENLFSLFDGKPMISNVKRRECTWDVNGAMQCADDDASFVDNYNMIYLLPIQSRKKGWLAENLTLGYRGLVTG